MSADKNKIPSVKIIIATHKEFRMPADPMYIPLHVGASGKSIDLGYVKDNTGENISELNNYFCELTGLYWAWKNLDANYIGLVHYRRHFALKKHKDSWESILTYKQLNPYLGKIKVFTPSKRKYYIESLYDHYAHTHYSAQLDETRNVILKKYPEYIESFDRVLKRTYGYMFNMMIMEKNLLNEYCSWLFDILFEVGKNIDTLKLSKYQRRYYGRISEIFFNVWLDKKIVFSELDQSELLEIPYIHMERINWWKKGTAFLKAKFLGIKYEGSF